MLCESFRFHGACLLDLEDGQLTELEIYEPHETLVAELADPQTERGFMRMFGVGNAHGYMDSYEERIEIKIPINETITKPALCKDCRKQISDGLVYDRYIIADLYKDKELIPITENMEIKIRCYTITTGNIKDGIIQMTIQGDLE